ncbi:hypothetical protein RvY_10659 [Ramazzottius varieornatus]|uniref:Uncharacterized protein n=1 Tax=Ramazzottius varieornatus TaxID=947166 RepID=A0A1D1VMH5_RAMVA|nr:hypothetical protein RvY_10659 [Ramazzottius varieornatus]
MDAVAALAAIAEMESLVKPSKEYLTQKEVLQIHYALRIEDIPVRKVQAPSSKKTHKVFLDEGTMDSPRGILKREVPIVVLKGKKKNIRKGKFKVSGDATNLSRRVSWSSDVVENEPARMAEDCEVQAWSDIIKSMEIPTFESLQSRKQQKEPKRRMTVGKPKPVNRKRAPRDAIVLSEVGEASPTLVVEGWCCPSCALPNLMDAGVCVNAECWHLKPTSRSLVKVPL